MSNVQPAPPNRNFTLRTNERFEVHVVYHGSDNVTSALPYLVAPRCEFNKQFVFFIHELALSVVPTWKVENADFTVDFRGPEQRNDGRFEGKFNALTQNTSLDKVLTVITIKNNNLWKAAPTTRQQLRANLLDIGSKLQQAESGPSRVLVPGAAAIIVARIAEVLPVPINESLLYRYNLNSGLNGGGVFVDLHPGMRLRLDQAANQFVGPGSPLNGPVASGQLYYHVGRDSQQRIVFDNFLGGVAAPQLPSPGLQANSGGLADLQAPGMARRHYRLFYPPQLPAPTSAGDQRLERNVTLVGTDSLTDLANATSDYTQRGMLGSNGSVAAVAAAFRGRAVVVPEICVFVRLRLGGQLHTYQPYLPLGTTVAQLLDQLFPTWNPRLLYRGNFERNESLILRRFWFEPTERDAVPEYRKIILNASQGAAPDVRVFDLPLVKGDWVELSFDEN